MFKLLTDGSFVFATNKFDLAESRMKTYLENKTENKP